jgi:diguanylate cyclase (GGDEF)-like protein
MRQKPIEFRELLERLLPLDQLEPADRLHVQRALRDGVGRQLEEAALFALRRLESSGAVRRLPPARNGDAGVVRYQARDRLDVITLRLPGPRRQGGWLVFPRASLPLQAQTGLDQIRRLLRVDDPALISDPRHRPTLAGLTEQLQQAGRELLGAAEVRLIPADPVEAGDAPAVAPAVAAAARARPGDIHYCPDATQVPGLAEAARRAGGESVVVAGVPDGEGRGIAHLEAFARGREAFRPEDLARMALLADYSGAMLERAARLEKLVFIDPLTTAYNRSYFDLQIQNEMARANRESSSLALCIADIDDFKNFNTTYGYQAGNEVLVQVAHALRRGVRPFDTVARWGGEEFAVLLTPPVHGPDVAAVSERLRTLVERQTVTLEGLDRRLHRVGVTVSIGVAMYPDHARTAEDLWRAANQALLEAKRPPKNQVVFHQPPPRPQ